MPEFTVMVEVALDVQLLFPVPVTVYVVVWFGVTVIEAPVAPLLQL